MTDSLNTVVAFLATPVGLAYVPRKKNGLLLTALKGCFAGIAPAAKLLGITVQKGPTMAEGRVLRIGRYTRYCVYIVHATDLPASARVLPWSKLEGIFCSCSEREKFLKGCSNIGELSKVFLGNAGVTALLRTTRTELAKRGVENTVPVVPRSGPRSRQQAT